MRDILFRGKDKDDGKWYEGAYRAYDDTTYCFKEDYDRHPENTHHTIIFSRMTDWGLPNQHLQVEVIPETVGQYAGLKDKNGKRIFEDDIVRVKGESDDYRGVDYCALIVFWNGGFCAIDGTKENHAFRRYCLATCDYSLEVIGNIHDNPELLEQE